MVDFYEVVFGPSARHGSGGVASCNCSWRDGEQRDALVKGFNWLFGENRIGHEHASAQRAYVSIAPRCAKERTNGQYGPRATRSVVNARQAAVMLAVTRHRDLILRQECQWL